MVLLPPSEGSRICVKNLPKHVGEDRVREIFSQKGEITDIKLMRTKDGKSRQFAFIGFRSDQEAEEALRYFNSSYIDTCRIACEIARKIGDPNIPRPWSRYSSKKVEIPTEEKKTIAGEKPSNWKNRPTKSSGEDDPKLQEFLQVMQPRSKSKLWANDSMDSSSTAPNVKPTHLGKVEAVVGNAVVDPLPMVEDNVVRGELVSDMDYFKSRVKEWSDSDDDHDEDNIPVQGHNHNKSSASLKEDTSDVSGQKGQNMELDNTKDDFQNEGSREEIPSSDHTGRLFVRNLPYSAMEDELAELFKKFGELSEVHVVLDKGTKRSKGIAYVLFALPESASRALEELDGSAFQGRLLHIMPAKPKKQDNWVETLSGDSLAKTFKEKRKKEKKESEASGNTRAWNSLFVVSDTVVENIARKHGIRKSDLLDPEADDVAVRVALAETQVISETKKALENAGVNVGLLEDFACGKAKEMRRSNHVFLVKNLPYGSSESELASMFGKFGSLERVILPSTKALALVVYLEPSEARAAFRNLAYKRYKDLPLYLEWAPERILHEKFASKNPKDVVIGKEDARKALLEQEAGIISAEDVDPERVESRTLFVKNLNFKTTDQSLKDHFTQRLKEGKILSVKVKKHLKNGKNVSMGFGFIEFDSVEIASLICMDNQGTVLDGHGLILQLCRVKNDENVLAEAGKNKNSAKLIVRNVAFEATAKDLRQLFSPFGQIKSLRLPKKIGSHRGFAFVEFITKQEAQNAIKALASTHLYGRHLVLEIAKEGESLEELRARTAAKFVDEHNGFQNPVKFSKKRKHMAVLDEGNIRF